MSDRPAAVKPLDKINPMTEGGGGISPPQDAFCSAHWFDYHPSGIVALATYAGGLRLIDVRDPRQVKQFGYATFGASGLGRLLGTEAQPQRRGDQRLEHRLHRRSGAVAGSPALIKELCNPPAVPGSAHFTTVDRMVTVRLEPMTQSEYEAWRVVSVEQYSLEFVKSGILTEPEARKRGESDFARLLSDGLATTHHELFSAYDGTELVGSLWLLFSTESDPEASSFVYELAVLPDNRRRGYGRAIMQVAIDQCRECGVVAMSLNVFGHNTGARALYDSLGFQVSSTFMKLPL